MNRPMLLACTVLALTSCTRGDVWGARPDHVAAVRLAGVTDVVLERPEFACDPNGEIPRAGSGSSEYYQRGFFFRGKMNGVTVRGAICAGKARPPRILINRPAAGGGVVV